MRCEQAEPLLGAWRDGELEGLTQARVRWHVRHCTHCASEVARLDNLTARLASLDPVIGYDAPRGWARPLLPRVSLAAAACLLCLIIGRQWHPVEPVGTLPVATVTPRTHALKRGEDRHAVVAVVPKTVVAAVALQRRRVAVARRRIRTYPAPHPVVARYVRRRVERPVTLAAVLRKTAVPVSPSDAEVIRVSVKITDPQVVVRQVRAEMAEAARVEASREFIYVVATPELVGNLVPATVAETSDTTAEEKP